MIFTSSLARFARRRNERKRKTAMAPVRRTLVAVWIKEGSSVVANTGESVSRISMGPSSSGTV